MFLLPRTAKKGQEVPTDSHGRSLGQSQSWSAGGMGPFGPKVRGVAHALPAFTESVPSLHPPR